MRLRSSTG